MFSNVSELAELHPDTESLTSSAVQAPDQQRAEIDSPHTSNAPWYAVTVCPRHEKKVAGHLEVRGFRCFVPTYRSVRRWKDRRKELDMVLFPGYAFVKVVAGDRRAILTAPGVVRFVTCGGQPAPVAEHEIKAISASLTSGAVLQPHPYLKKGRRVRLVGGALAGVEGILVRRKDRFRLILSVDLIMRSVALEVDECEVEPC